MISFYNENDFQLNNQERLVKWISSAISDEGFKLGGIWNGLGYNTHIYPLQMVVVLYEFVRLSNQRFFRAGNIQELLVISR